MESGKWKVENEDEGDENDIPNSSSLIPNFTDVPEGAYYYDAVLWAASVGIVGGYGDGTFGPDDPITRQDLVVILARYADYMGIIVGDAVSGVPQALGDDRPYTGFTDNADIMGYAKEAIKRLYSAGIINGYPNGGFKPKATAPRAEVAAMFMRFLEAMELATDKNSIE